MTLVAPNDVRFAPGLTEAGLYLHSVPNGLDAIQCHSPVRKREYHRHNPTD